MGSLSDLGLVALAQGEEASARSLQAESLVIHRETRDRQGIANTLERIAACTAAQAQPERTARLLGAAEALRESLGVFLRPFDRADHDRVVATARAHLGEAVFAAACTEGRALGLEEAVTYALEGSDGAAGDTR